jgi:hypothetical protein
MKLTAGARKGIIESEFALPGRRFPLVDKSHDRAAISGASKSLHAGNITPADAATVVRKAKAKLGR